GVPVNKTCCIGCRRLRYMVPSDRCTHHVVVGGRLIIGGEITYPPIGEVCIDTGFAGIFSAHRHVPSTNRRFVGKEVSLPGRDEDSFVVAVSNFVATSRGSPVEVRHIVLSALSSPVAVGRRVPGDRSIEGQYGIAIVVYWHTLGSHSGIIP